MEDVDLERVRGIDFIIGLVLLVNTSPLAVFGVFAVERVGVDKVIAGVRGMVRGRPPMLRPVWVCVGVNLTGESGGS